MDSQLSQTGESRLVPRWFESAAGRYLSWANTYLDTNYAQSLYHDDIPATEWPMFGSVFFLVTAEELQKQGKIDATQGTIREAVEKAAEIVASPVTATWVKTKWGDGYLEKENVFYRMLLILGLSSYERITGDTQYHALMSRPASRRWPKNWPRQNCTCATTTPTSAIRPTCFGPWRRFSVRRGSKTRSHDELAKSLMAAFDGPLKAAEGLPAFQADAQIGSNSPGGPRLRELGHPPVCRRTGPGGRRPLVRAYEKNFWKDTGWIAGFTEMPQGSPRGLMDVDSGPVLWEFGSVASAFGIGAAKSVGRFDHAAPLTMEAVACSWPTPFGPLIPG